MTAVHFQAFAVERSLPAKTPLLWTQDQAMFSRLYGIQFIVSMLNFCLATQNAS
jgi:hypothetical protein